MEDRERGIQYPKNGGYRLKHKYSRKNLNATQNYYQCMQVAHMINQLVELSSAFKPLLANKTTARHLWKVMIAFMFFGHIDPAILQYKKTQFRYS